MEQEYDYKTTWDSQMPYYEPWNHGYQQRDWNQTFMTKINQISAQMSKQTLSSGANRIIVHPLIFNHLILTLEYTTLQQNRTYKLAGRYDIEISTKTRIDEVLVRHPLVYDIEGVITILNADKFLKIKL